MNISDIEVNQKNIEVTGKIIEISRVKEFSKFGKIGRVASAILKDDSSQIQLTLWDEQIESVKKGDKIKIMNAYVKEWQGEKQLNIGRYGSVEILK